MNTFHSHKTRKMKKHSKIPIAICSLLYIIIITLNIIYFKDPNHIMWLYPLTIGGGIGGYTVTLLAIWYIEDFTDLN